MPFGNRNGNLFFQRISHTVRYIMRIAASYVIICYDDFLGLAPHQRQMTFSVFICINGRFGHHHYQAKSSQHTSSYLGVLVHTGSGTFSIAENKFSTIEDWVYIYIFMKPFIMCSQTSLCRCSTGADWSVTKHFWRVGTNVYMVG